MWEEWKKERKRKKGGRKPHLRYYRLFVQCGCAGWQRGLCVYYKSMELFLTLCVWCVSNCDGKERGRRGGLWKQSAKPKRKWRGGCACTVHTHRHTRQRAKATCQHGNKRGCGLGHHLICCVCVCERTVGRSVGRSLSSGGWEKLTNNNNVGRRSVAGMMCVKFASWWMGGWKDGAAKQHPRTEKKKKRKEIKGTEYTHPAPTYVVRYYPAIVVHSVEI